MTRVFLTGMRVQITQLMRSSFDLVAMLIWPIIYASIAYYLLDATESPHELLAASIGSAVMIMWAQVVIGSAGTLDLMRQAGTLELMVAAPVPFVAVLAPIMVSTSAFGLYGLVVTLAWGRFGFGIPLSIVHPFAFAIAIPACVIAIAALGLIVASTFVLYRAAFSLGIAMQYPVWLASGLLVPLSALPRWLGPVSWTLAPTWAFRAIERAAVGGDPWTSVGLCAVVSVVYVGVAVFFLRLFEHLARQRASLKLA